MAQVKVWNDNIHPYKEKFQDRLIEIPAGQSIEMDVDEAKRFLSKCNGVLKDGDGQPDPRGFKRLRIETKAGQAAPAAKSTVYVSHLDGREFATKKELEQHLEQFKDRVVTDEKAEAAMQASAPQTRRRRSENGAA